MKMRVDVFLPSQQWPVSLKKYCLLVFRQCWNVYIRNEWYICKTSLISAVRNSPSLQELVIRRVIEVAFCTSAPSQQPIRRWRHLNRCSSWETDQQWPQSSVLLSSLFCILYLNIPRIVTSRFCLLHSPLAYILAFRLHTSYSILHSTFLCLRTAFIFHILCSVTLIRHIYSNCDHRFRVN